MSKLTEKQVMDKLREMDSRSEISEELAPKKSNEVNDLCKLFATKYFQILRVQYVISHIDRITNS